MEEDVFAGLVGLQSKASSAKIAPAPAYHVRPQPVLNTRKNRVQTACTACKKRKTKVKCPKSTNSFLLIA